MLEVRNLTLRYGQSQILHGIDLTAPRGEVTAVMGTNGVGKTSLLKAIAGRHPFRSGSLRLDGRDLGHPSAFAAARAGIAYVPQGREVFPLMTVMENLETGFACLDSTAREVPESKTVPYVYEDAATFRAMPKVFATAFLVGLLERCCVELLLDHIDWPDEMTVGTHVDVSHLAATPPGRTVTVEATLVEVDGRRLVFELSAHDGEAEISRGRHERHIVDAARFRERLGLSDR